MELRLIVIRTGDQKRLSEFYALLGLNFDYHKHGNAPLHYSATIGQTVLEIYPLAKSQEETDRHLRLGFSIDKFDERIKHLQEKHVMILSQPMETEFGFMAVIQDPDGRKIELYKR